MNQFVSTEAKAWHVLHRGKIWKRPQPYGKTWAQDFPLYAGDLAKCAEKKGACPYIGYARTACRKPLVIGNVLTATFKIDATGAPTFNHKMEPSNTSDYPATLRVFIQRKRDNWIDANGRFWCRTVYFRLAATGPVTLTVPLTPDIWTNVAGQRDDGGFAETLAKIGNAGFSFGGGYFFSHGVNVSGGTAKLVLLDFNVGGGA